MGGIPVCSRVQVWMCVEMFGEGCSLQVAKRCVGRSVVVSCGSFLFPVSVASSGPGSVLRWL